MYAFICDELAHGRGSPSITEIARRFGFSITRAKQLVDRLVKGGWITRAAGAQRAIQVPGRARAHAIEILRAEGFAVDEDLLEVSGGFPKLQLPALPDLVHIPDDFSSGGGDDRYGDLQQRA